MLLDELHAKRDEIQSLGRHYGARRIRVFGSVARREERTDSDMDFLVDFPRGYNLFVQRMPLTDQLALLLQRPVEVIPEYELNRHIREQALRNLQTLSEATQQLPDVMKVKHPQVPWREISGFSHHPGSQLPGRN